MDHGMVGFRRRYSCGRGGDFSTERVERGARTLVIPQCTLKKNRNGVDRSQRRRPPVRLLGFAEKVLMLSQPNSD